MKTLTILLAAILCSCSTTDVSQTQRLLDAVQVAFQHYEEKPTK